MDCRSSSLSPPPSQLHSFTNKSATHVHVVHLEAFRDLGQSGGYAWGAVVLVHMYD